MSASHLNDGGSGRGILKGPVDDDPRDGICLQESRDCRVMIEMRVGENEPVDLFPAAIPK